MPAVEASDGGSAQTMTTIMRLMMRRDAIGGSGGIIIIVWFCRPHLFLRRYVVYVCICRDGDEIDAHTVVYMNATNLLLYP